MEVQQLWTRHIGRFGCLIGFFNEDSRGTWHLSPGIWHPSYRNIEGETTDMHHPTAWRRAVAATVAALTLCAGGAVATANAADGPVKADINVKAIDGLADDFIGGADVSSMLSLEESGVTFKNEEGKAEDLFALLKESGVNYVRLRVWNDPFTADGQGYGGGNVNAERALVMAKRATAAGLKVLVDFHYSDFWADPSKQQTPKAWKSFEGDADKTAQAVYDYTRKTLTEFKNAGVDVGMVQIGNETTAKIAGVTGWDGMCKVFSAGSKAVRETLPDAKVAIHFTNPERNTYAGYAKQLDSHKVDYDVFASSYYPFWHGTADNLTRQLKNVAATYGKDVMVAETSWAYTLEDGDDDSNTITAKNVNSADMKFDVSAQGQADALRYVAEAVNKVGDNDGDGENDGLGMFYWEPAWLPVGQGGRGNADLVALWEKHGAGWATQAAGEYDPNDAGKKWGGSGVDNQALFTFDGTALPSLKTFAYLHTGAVTDHVFTGIDDIAIEASDEDSIDAIRKKLPSEVTARYKDGVDETETVTWRSGALDWIRGAGTYTVTGVTPAGHTAKAVITVTAAPPENHIVNGGFEDGANAGWSVTGSGASIKFDKNSASAGTWALGFWADKAYAFTAEQTVTGLKPGAYTLTAKGQGALVGGTAGVNKLTLNAKSGDATKSDEIGLNGWKVWDTASVPVTVGDDGTVTVTIRGDLGAGDWGSVDEVTLTRDTKTADKPDTDTLETELAKAETVERDGYTAESLDRLDDAIDAAHVLLAGSTYTNNDVTQVTKLLSDALEGLEAKTFVSISVTPKKTAYTVGDTIEADDLTVTGNYEAGSGSVELAAGQYTLDYDFSAPADAAKVTVSLTGDPNLAETYMVKVTAKDGGSGDSGSDGSGDGATTPDGKTDGGTDGKPQADAANGGGIAATGSAVAAVAAIALTAAFGGVALAIRRRKDLR